MWDSLDKFFEGIVDLFLIPLLGGGLYVRGFVFGMGFALLLGLLARIILFDKGRILRFFSAIQPSLKPSPSGFTSMTGCIISLIRLVIIAVFLAAVLAGLLRACATL